MALWEMQGTAEWCKAVREGAKADWETWLQQLGKGKEGKVDKSSNIKHHLSCECSFSCKEGKGFCNKTTGLSHQDDVYQVWRLEDWLIWSQGKCSSWGFHWGYFFVCVLDNRNTYTVASWKHPSNPSKKGGKEIELSARTLNRKKQHHIHRGH